MLLSRTTTPNRPPTLLEQLVMAPPVFHPIVVRACTRGDYTVVAALARRLAVGIAPWRQHEAFVQAARRWIDASVQRSGSDHAAFVAEDADQHVVGFASVAQETHFTGETQAYLGELVVAAHAEGQSVGRALLAAAEAWARERGYRIIVLDKGSVVAEGKHRELMEDSPIYAEIYNSQILVNEKGGAQ